MGMFHDEVKIWNRTTSSSKPRDLEVIFDGQRKQIPVGESTLPRIVIPYAKDQNPVMGSEDAIDPSEYQSLIAVVGKDDCSPVEPTGSLTRVNFAEMIDDPTAQILVRGKSVPRAGDSFVTPPGGGMADHIAHKS